MKRSTRGMFARSKPGYRWEDHRGAGANPPGDGLIFYVPVGYDKASVACISVDGRAILATVTHPKHVQRRSKTLAAAKRWIERNAR
jgi:hypothetical protein